MFKQVPRAFHNLMLDPAWDAHNWGAMWEKWRKKIDVDGLLLFFENLGPPQASNIFTLIYYNIEQGVCHTLHLH